MSKILRVLQNPNKLRLWGKLSKYSNSNGWFWAYPATWNYYLAMVRKNHWSEVSGNHRRRYITMTPAYHSEGIGGQLTKWNTALILAKKFDLTFVHYPFTSSSHNPGCDWETFFNFGQGEVAFADVNSQDSVRVLGLPPFCMQSGSIDCFGRSLPMEYLQANFESVNDEVLFCLGPPTWAYDQLPTAELLRSKYWQTRAQSPVPYPFNRDKINVAVHIRRGDVNRMKMNNEGDWRGRWLDEAYYVKVCTRINELLGTSRVAIHIYSDGDINEFKNLSKISNAEFHLAADGTSDPFGDFHAMVVADVLVVGSSSFSYFAGIISEGTKIAKYPWVHHIPSDDYWIRSDSTGNFEPHTLIRNFPLSRFENPVPVGFGSSVAAVDR